MYEKLASGVKPEGIGPALYQCIAPGREAYKAVEGTQVKDLYIATGCEKLFGLLDVRFPDEEDEDKLGAKTDDAIDLTIKRDAVMPTYVGRGIGYFDKLKAHTPSVALPDEIRGRLLVRGVKLQTKEKALVVTLAGESWKEGMIKKALIKAFPGGYADLKSAGAFMIDPGDGEKPILVNAAPDNDGINDQDVLIFVVDLEGS